MLEKIIPTFATTGRGQDTVANKSLSDFKVALEIVRPKYQITDKYKRVVLAIAPRVVGDDDQY